MSYVLLRRAEWVTKGVALMVLVAASELAMCARSEELQIFAPSQLVASLLNAPHLSSTRRKSEPVVLNRETGGGGSARSTVRAPETALDTTRPFTGMVRTKESEDQAPSPMSPA